VIPKSNACLGARAGHFLSAIAIGEQRDDTRVTIRFDRCAMFESGDAEIYLLFQESGYLFPSLASSEAGRHSVLPVATP
jgi:hypothetical protein